MTVTPGEGKSMQIRILDEETIGRIAAGEVAEQPSAVAKELIENAIDAGASAITVEQRGGGIDYLRVTDNGCGIEAGQLRLAFSNHATSKLRNADQLADIRTLGFRGEALPSIAAVSHVEMTTRVRNAASGNRVLTDGGRDFRVSEVGCPEGTTFIMRDMFYNVPVRRSFLKKPSYEGGLINDVVARMIIGNPSIAFHYISNGNTVYRSNGDGSVRHAVFSVYGRQTAEKMTEIDAAEGSVRISGLIDVGDLAKATRAHQMFFINGRSVRCALLQKVLEVVCQTRVTIGMYPMCALALSVPQSSIDVNVHPNKLEIRFRDEIVMRLAAEKLLKSAFEGEKALDLKKETTPPAAVQPTTRIERVHAKSQEDAGRMPPLPELPSSDPRETKAERPARPISVQEAFPLREGEKAEQAPPVRGGRLREDFSFVLPDRPIKVVGESSPQGGEQHEPDGTGTAPSVSYRIAGVLYKTYILLETERAVLVIDQHAAHERLRYEKYKKQMEMGTASQQLLTPSILRLSEREIALLMDQKEVLAEAGYEIEPFGDNEIRVTAVPQILGKAELRLVFLDMINELYRLKEATREVRRAEIMQMSCKSAVKGGDALTDSEIRSLLQELESTGASPTCPHGRPIVRSFQRRELEKLFKRIQ